jgi:triacylglycerol lipase
VKLGKLILILLISILNGCIGQKEIRKSAKICKTRYPIVLVHGIAYRDDITILPYWSKIPDILTKNGACVFLSHTEAFNSHIDNAIILKNRILEIMKETGAEKVNIIAHSKGGLEARWMISRLDMADKVASLTTVASPHKGSYIADSLLKTLEFTGKSQKTFETVRIYAQLIGDKNPDVYTAAENLTVDYMKNFNRSVTEMPQVYYQSFGTVENEDYPLECLHLSQQILKQKEGCNDSQVSLESSKYGKFTFVQAPDEFGMSHFDIAGMRFISKASTFDAEQFYVEIVKNLKLKGF